MARQIARSWEGHTSRRLRKKIEILFAHLKRILKLDRLRYEAQMARVWGVPRSKWLSTIKLQHTGRHA